jgi:Flp pilus assembly protein TadB
MGVMVIQVIVFIIIAILGIFLIRLSIALKKERRISRYTTPPTKEQADSLLDDLSLSYNRFVKKFSIRLSKINFINNIAKRYNKYVLVGDETNLTDFIVHKIVIGIIFVFIVMISYALQFKMIGMFQIVLFFIIGYYVYDIYLIIYSKRRIKMIRNDMLRAVMIMNNAFKSGKSIMQAVNIASKQLPYPINYEFKKIYQDMRYGLSVDIVFDRFAKRVNIEEASYMASTLTILNKTGGNIVAVFNSIEKTLFDKKKLEEELKNLTGASNLVVKILFFVPFIFTGIIYILNPSYFDPLFNNPLGCFVIFIIIIMLSIYIWFLRKIMKVRY